MLKITDIFEEGFGPNSTAFALAKFSKWLHDMCLSMDTKKCKIYFYNSLAKVAKDIWDEKIIKRGLDFIPFEIIYETRPNSRFKHPYALSVEIIGSCNKTIATYKCNIVGRGKFEVIDNDSLLTKNHNCYSFKNFAQMRKFFETHKMSYLDYCCLFQDKQEIKECFDKIINLANFQIKHGLTKKGKITDIDANILDNVYKSKILYTTKSKNEDFISQATRIISSYCYAIGEWNASDIRHTISFPTPGSLPFAGLLIYLIEKYKPTEEEKLNAFCAMGLFASLYIDLIPKLAFQSGCHIKMASGCGMLAIFTYMIQFKDSDFVRLEQCFECAIEHTLGIACISTSPIPIDPCIQRFALFSLRALDIASLVHLTKDTPELVKLDDAIKTQVDTYNDTMDDAVEGFSSNMFSVFKKK